MRVLWIAQNGGLYKNAEVKGTGGWIGALQSVLTAYIPSLELGIVFPYNGDKEVLQEGNVTYFPFTYGPSSNKIVRGLQHLLRNKKNTERMFVENIINAINNFNPDVVHMWGLEHLHAASLPLIKKPCVLHIQGLTSLYKFTYCTPFFSEKDLKSCDSFFERIVLRHGQWAKYRDFVSRAERELKYAPYVKYWIGRTEWDYQASLLLSPNSRYFHCEEMMRNDFICEKWKFHFTDMLHIQSNISCDWYKGVDVVLKTAALLKKYNQSFVWNIYGIDRDSSMVKYMTRKLGICPKEVNVIFNGRVLGSAIRDSLLEADVYCHPAFIENSSNAIAEAMMMGVPTVAQYVGGNPTMLKDNSGILVAPNEPYVLASALLKMRDAKTANFFSSRAISVATERQNRNIILNNLVAIYQTVIDENDQ